jgi:hypothetical protein
MSHMSATKIIRILYHGFDMPFSSSNTKWSIASPAHSEDALFGRSMGNNLTTSI